MEYMCGNDDLGLGASLVNAVARKDDLVSNINDLDTESMTRTYPGKPIDFVFSRLMDFDRVSIYVAPVGFKPGTTTKEVAYYFDVECFANGKWETVYKWPHYDPLCAKFDKSDPPNCIKVRAFDLDTPGWKTFEFKRGTDDKKKKEDNKKWSNEKLKPYHTRQRKCSQPSAQWRLTNIRGHPEHPIKVATTYDVMFSSKKPKEAMKGAPTTSVPPLGGKCGMTITRSGNKDVIRWGRCPKKESGTTYRCGKVEAHFEPVSGKCDSVTDMNPGTFTRFEANGGSLLKYNTGDKAPAATERIWLFKHRLHHKHYALRSFLFTCGDKGSKGFWTQRVDLRELKDWTSIKQGWVGVWLCKACVERMLSAQEFTNEHHHPKHEGHVYIAEILFAPSTVRKATLPPPLNGKIQLEWCVRHQSVTMPFEKKSGKWPQSWPYSDKMAQIIKPEDTRTMGRFKPNFAGIPCGSTITAQFTFKANRIENKKKKDVGYHGTAMFATIKSPCDDSILNAGFGLPTTLRASKPSKFQGWPASLVDAKYVEVTTRGRIFSRYTSSFGAGRSQQVNAVANDLELVYWYRPIDISMPCATQDM